MKIIIETRPGAAEQWVAEATWAGCEAPVRAVSCDPAQAVVWAAERARFDISTAHNLPPVHPAHHMAAQSRNAPPRPPRLHRVQREEAEHHRKLRELYRDGPPRKQQRPDRVAVLLLAGTATLIPDCDTRSWRPSLPCG